jgi:hypothetical protein
MLLPRAYELAIVSEEERRTREQGNKMNQGKKMNKREGRPPNFTQSHPHATIHIHAQTKSTQIHPE